VWQGRIGIAALVAGAALVAMPLYLPSSNSAGGNDQVEVYSWWTGPGEEDGLHAMVTDFQKRYPGIRFINAAVSGGAGSNAKAILATRLLANDPPDSYQRHAGLELADDVRSGKVEDLTALYREQGWTDVFPKGLLDKLTIDGKVWAVPVNIHRANLMWYEPRTLAKLGISGPPKTWKDFLAQAQIIKAKGLTPLTIGPEWTQKQLLETVLLGQLGADGYERLWTNPSSWTEPQTVDALRVYKQVLAVSDIASSAADWQPQIDRVTSGAAVYAVMGDWADSYLSVTKKLAWQRDYSAVATPGSDGVYDFLSDSFTLPVGARHPVAARDWLLEAGSTDGENLFNPLKGSVPARLDADPAKYTGYLSWALRQWRDPKIRIVGSLTHGVVADNAWNAEIDTALGLFVEDGNVAKFAATVAEKYEETR
jgi:glucose/mannose transport system substrate-binding protein